MSAARPLWSVGMSYTGASEREWGISLSGVRVALVALCLLPVGVAPVVKGPAAAASATPGEVTGWSGTDPEVVGLGLTDNGDGTAAFTTSTGQGVTLWSAVQAGASWTAARAVSNEVVTGSADLAVNGAGRAILVWDAPTVGSTGSTLWAVTRDTAHGDWSAPVALATDDGEHRASVGVDDQGVSTVAYVATDGGTGAVLTRREDDGGWSSPLQHSGRPTREALVAVSPTGYVTLGWVEDDGDAGSSDGPDRLMLRRFLPSLGSWGAITDGGLAAPDGLDAVVAGWNDGATVASHYPRELGYRVSQVSVVPDDPLCDFGCSGSWQSLGSLSSYFEPDRVPDVAVTQDTWEFFGATLALTNQELGDGTERLIVESLDNRARGAVQLLTPPGEYDGVAVIARHSHVVAGWVNHGPASASLVTETMRRPSLDAESAAVVWGQIAGRPAFAEAPTGVVKFLWVDATDDNPVLRVDRVPAYLTAIKTVDFPRRAGTEVSWRTARSSAATTYDVRRYTLFDEGDEVDPGVRIRTVRRSTPSSAGRFHIAAGTTACFIARAHDGAGHRTAWSARSCATAAVDDRSLTGRGWQIERSDAYYKGHRLTARRAGAVLRLPQRTLARPLALLVTTRPHGGKVDVMWGHHRITTVSTRGQHRNRVVVPVPFEGPLASRRLTLRTTTNRPVSIDGVFLARG